MAVETNMPMPGDSKHEIAFIDMSVSGYETLLAGVRDGVEVVLIDGAHDGLVQIAAALEGRSGIDALHILSHGSAGALALGSGTIDLGSLDSHGAELTAIRSALGEHGDILLYGCDVGAGIAGTAFISRLAELTGADLTASEDLTGSAVLGGNWVLEQQHGAIEAQSALSDSTAFAGVLGVPVLEDFTGDPEDQQGNTRENDGWTYTFLDGNGQSWLTDGLNFGFQVTSGNSLTFTSEEDVYTLELKSTDTSPFSLRSFTLESVGDAVYVSATTLDIEGYYNGQLITTASVDLTGSGTGVTYTKSTIPGTVGGELVFVGAEWANIDRIVLKGTNGLGINWGIDNIETNAATPFPTISSASYDASTGVLSVTGADLVNGHVIDATKLTLTGQGGATFTLTSGTGTATSATAFSITLSAADQLYVNGLLNKNASVAVDGSTYNLAAASGWNTSAFAPADTTSNGITVSNVQAPSISSATYDASTNTLTVTGSQLVHVAGNDITTSKLVLTGEGGTNYTLTGAGVEITGASSFAITLSGADLAAVELMFNKNGNSSTGGTAYNLAAGDDWNSVITGGNTAVSSATVTVSNVPVPAIDSATYDGASGTLVVTGTGFTKLSGSANDILANKLTITGEGGATYTLTGSGVEITSGTSFTIVLDSTDQAGVNALLNKTGSSSTGGTTYNLAAANGWAAGADDDAVLTLAGHLPSTAGVLVDTTAPEVTGVSVPADETYAVGEHLDFTVTFNENLTLAGAGSTLGLTIGSTAHDAAFLSSTGSTVTYRYTVQAGDADANGITVGSLTLNGHTIRDAAGNDAVLTLNSVGATGSVLVDGTVPTVTGTMTVPGNDTYVVGETLDFTVTFDENITRAGTASTLGLTVGGSARNATITATTGNSITYSYTVQNGDNDTDGIAVTGISLNGGTIRDAAGNNADLTLAGHLPSTAGVLVDTTAPEVAGNISVPANASYNAGDVLRFTVTFDENVTLAGSGSTLGLTIGSTAREAVFESSTANSITYAYTVQAGETDANGIAVGSITLNGHTIKDAAGNDAVLTLAGHLPSTAGVLVDTTAPEVASVSVPSNDTYVAGEHLDFTVTFDENVTVGADDSTLGLTIGSTARNAVWLSSSGNTVTYRYTVQAGDVDADGITVGSLALNGDTIRDAAGNDAVLTLTSVGATGSVLVDGTVPSVTGTITAPGNDTYVVGETLEFTVTFTENVAVTGTDSTLALTIGSTSRTAQFVSNTGNTVTYSYTVQAGDNDADGIAVGAIALGSSTIRDAAGNDAALALTGHVPALTGVLVDTAAPALLTATVNGAIMVLTYSDASQLDAANVPPGSAFGVLVAGSPVLVNTVVVNAAAHTVTLTLASAVSNGQAVSVAYADPTGGNDANAIQDAAGNDAASLASTAVVNNTPSPGTPPVTGTVDGVPVQTGTVTNPDGSTSQVVTVPVVTPSRVEQVGNNTVADIPLVKDAGGTSLLTVQVPVGVGLQASGGGQAKPAGNSLTDLIHEIQAHTTAGSQDQNQLTGGGSGFLDALSSDTPLLVQTIVVTGNGGSSGTPLGIIGQPQATGSVQTALVIDARGLPNGAALELQNVEFAAVIGAATVTGGAGSQHVWGDGASQNIFLGADDDVLHGGAGDDIVGSAGGNDMIYGDEGNDLVFGGEGNDLLDGGTGQDIARFSGRSDGYSLRVVDGKLVMAAQAGSDGTDTVVAVETLRFSGGQSSADDAVLARLYEGLLHRSGSAAEVAYWQDVHARGVPMHDVAAAILGSAESGQLGNPGSTSSHGGFVAGLYQNVLGRGASAEESAYWTGLLDSGVDRATVALGFVNSAEKLSTALDLDFNHSDVAVLLRMYHAMFGRAPDEAGLNYWLGVHEQGASLGTIADAFAVSAEAQGLLAQGDNAAFIDQLYQTALERAPSSAENALLLEQLQQGVFDRGQVLLNVAESGESIAIVGSVNTSLSLL